MSFNTAISQMMIFVNGFSGNAKPLPRETAETFVLLLSPFAPHLGEELWERQHDKTLAYEPWPEYDEEYLKVDEVERSRAGGQAQGARHDAVVGRRGTMQRLALEQDAVREALDGKTIRKVICVPNRLINIVAN